MGVWELIFPKKCPLCGCLAEGICSSCSRQLQVVTEPRCRHCGKPIEMPEREYCMDCSGAESVLTQGTAVWVYDEKMKKAMADFKYGGCAEDGLYYGEQMIAWCGAQIAAWNVDCIVPVPLHWRRRWFRGYNQAECIARVLGEHFQLPVVEGLRRVRTTRPQKGLNDRERRENLRRAFELEEKSRYTIGNCHSVLLVDDIYTTGSTLEACGQVLREQEVKEIYFACLCIGKDY